MRKRHTLGGLFPYDAFPDNFSCSVFGGVFRCNRIERPLAFSFFGPSQN